MRFVLGILVGIVCIAPAAVVWVLGYQLIPGVILIGVSGAAAAAVVALPMRVVGQTSHPAYRAAAAAAALTLIACLLGVVLSMWYATGKTPAILFSPPERQATINTMQNIVQVIGYAVGVIAAYLWAGHRGWRGNR